jgi:hypothetical protein
VPTDPGTVRFAYPGRHRWAYVPTALFFAVLLLILWLRPEWLSNDGVDQGTRSAGLALGGVVLAIILVILALRWFREPYAVVVEREGLLLYPFLGAPRRVAFSSLVHAEERARPFLRGKVEMELRTAARRRIIIQGEISDYPKLRRLVLDRLPAEARERWSEPEG